VPLERYDKHFGGRRGAAAEALASMKKTYGAKNGEHVFYASIAKREHRAKARRKRGLWR
jgi:hypothetical protein